MGLFRAPRLPKAEDICISANPSACLWIYSSSVQVDFSGQATVFNYGSPVSSSGIMYDYRLLDKTEAVNVNEDNSIIAAYDSITPPSSIGGLGPIAVSYQTHIPFYSFYRQRPSVESNDGSDLYIKPYNWNPPFSSSSGGYFNYSNVPTFDSNCTNNGDGTSYILCHTSGSYNKDLVAQGSITINLWFDLEGATLNVGSNNNWRTLIGLPSGTSGTPISMVLEQSGVVNFTSGHDSGGSKRYLNGQFAPYTATTDGWQMITYTYDVSTGIAACYKNGSLVTSGVMSTTSGGSGATTAGDDLDWGNYKLHGYRVSTTNSSTNPAGNGCVPGQMGYFHVWKTALSGSDIMEIYDNFKNAYESI